MIGASLVLSLPVFALFLLVSHFGHGDPWMQAMRNGSYGLTVGPGLLAIIAVAIKLQPKSSAMSEICREVEAGRCKVTSHQVSRAWHLVDEGNDDAPDYIVQLASGAVVAIPRAYLGSTGQPRATLELSSLPNTGIAVGAAFSGNPVSVMGSIVTDNLWRNDDLPYLKPIPLKKLPAEVASAFQI